MQRSAEVPGLGVDSAQQIIAEVGASALVKNLPNQATEPVAMAPMA